MDSIDIAVVRKLTKALENLRQDALSQLEDGRVASERYQYVLGQLQMLKQVRAIISDIVKEDE